MQVLHTKLDLFLDVVFLVPPQEVVAAEPDVRAGAAAVDGEAVAAGGDDLAVGAGGLRMTLEDRRCRQPRRRLAPGRGRRPGSRQHSRPLRPGQADAGEQSTQRAENEFSHRSPHP